MKKILLPFIIVFAFKVNAQGWAPVGTYTWNSSMVSQGPVLTADTHYVYAAGGFTAIGTNNINNIAKWDGISWAALGQGLNQGTNALCTYNNILYAGGSFIATGGGIAANYIAQWDGSNWSSIGSGFNNAVFALCMYNGELYATGQFDSAGAIPVDYIAKWNGTAWSGVGGGITHGSIYSLATFQGNLYAIGSFTAIGGIPANNIAKWNGSNWSALGSGLTAFNYTNCSSGGLCLAANNQYLFVSGSFTNAGGVAVSGMAQWDGTNWYNNIPNGVCSLSCLYYDTTTSTLYAGSSDGYIAGWNGSYWFPACDSGGAFLVPPLSLAILKGSLYTNVNQSGSSSIYVAECSNPTALGIKSITNPKEGTSIYPNPNHGSFVIEPQNTLYNVHCTVYDVNGKMVLSQTINGKTSIDAGSLNEGVYNISLQSNEGVVNKRLVIVR